MSLQAFTTQPPLGTAKEPSQVDHLLMLLILMLILMMLVMMITTQPPLGCLVDDADVTVNGDDAVNGDAGTPREEKAYI